MGQLLRIGHHTCSEGPLELAADAFLATSDFTDATRHVHRRTRFALADDLEQGSGVHEITALVYGMADRGVLAAGYKATICSGVVTYENGVHTGEFPGRLVRGGVR